jgi:hypothetical protein
MERNDIPRRKAKRSYHSCSQVNDKIVHSIGGLVAVLQEDAPSPANRKT